MQSFIDERVRERQHQRDVGPGDNRQPLGPNELWQIIAERWGRRDHSFSCLCGRPRIYDLLAADAEVLCNLVLRDLEVLN
jgi:hypothetical protein